MSAHAWRDRRIAARYSRTQSHPIGPLREDEIEAFSQLTAPQFDVLVSNLVAQGRERARIAWPGYPTDDLSASVAAMWMVGSAGVPFAMPLWVLPHADPIPPRRDDHDDGIW
ncbi:MAG: hypothetical protein K0R99_4641 [Microbacterium sp.]|jgi:hypothetical protein|nr:hypothetical protein [Microbacterium sp.]